MCERSLDKRSRTNYHKLNGTFFCKEFYLHRKRPRRFLSDNERLASVDKTDIRSQSITLPFFGTLESHSKFVFVCERRILKRFSMENRASKYLFKQSIYTFLIICAPAFIIEKAIPSSFQMNLQHLTFLFQ